MVSALSNFSAISPAMRRDPNAAAKEVGVTLEATLVSQLIADSLSLGSGPEARFAADVFADVIAEAVARDGGLGVGRALEQSLGQSSGSAAGQAPAGYGVTALTPHAERAHPASSDTLTALLVEGKSRVSSAYGARKDPIHGAHRFHKGLDVAAKEGVPIRAIRGGTVVFAGERGGYGNCVEIDHGGGLRSLYAHASAIHVEVGEQVHSGTRIADVGNTGRSTGSHLHFEVRLHGRTVDPQRALKDSAIRVDTHYAERFPRRFVP